MRKLASLVILLFCAAVASAQDLPRIAVYVTGYDVGSKNAALGKQLLTRLVESGRYKETEQQGAFFRELAENTAKSGAVDYGRIREVGRRLGVAFVCVASVAADENRLSAHIIDLEAWTSVDAGEVKSPLETFTDASEAAKRIVAVMYGGAAQAQQESAPDTEQARSDTEPATATEPLTPEPEPVPPSPPIPAAEPLQAAKPAPAADADKPNIAVYVTGKVSEDEKSALGTRILASLVNSGRYRGIERSNTFLAEIDNEMVKQRSGAIDDNQISELGKQFGVKYICIADITPVYEAFQVSARIVNVETAEVAYIGEAFCPRKTALYITWVSDQVVLKMFGEKPLPEPNDPTRIRISVGAGAFFPGNIGGGVTWGNGEQAAMPYTGTGAYLFADARYAEVFVGYSYGSDKWESANTEPENLPEMSRSYLHAGALVKYPFGGGRLKFFPLMGVDYELSISSKLELADDERYVFNGKNGRLGTNALSAFWVRLGGGADFEMSRSVYMRSEFLYGLRTATAFEHEAASIGIDGVVTPGHGFTLKIGLGVRVAELNF